MIYATRTDIEDLYGPDFLAGLKPDGVSLDVAVGSALAASSAEIDVYVGQAYALPLPEIPVILRACASDMAIYQLANTWDRLTDEIRRRYDDRVRLLGRIADGKAELMLPGTEAATSVDGAVFASRSRRMGGDW